MSLPCFKCNLCKVLWRTHTHTHFIKKCHEVLRFILALFSFFLLQLFEPPTRHCQTLWATGSATPCAIAINPGPSSPWGLHVMQATACTINVYPAGCRDGYVKYGRHQIGEIRKLQRAKPYQEIKEKIKVHAHVSAEEKAQSVKRHLLRKGISSTVSVSFSFIPVPESPSAFDFQEIHVQEEVHKGSIALVERCIHKGRSMILKKYLRSTMSWHDSLLEQQFYEMNMYYQDLIQVFPMWCSLRVISKTLMETSPKCFSRSGRQHLSQTRLV